MTNATAGNALENDTKAQGGWAEAGSFRAVYQREIPITATIALAGFVLM